MNKPERIKRLKKMRRDHRQALADAKGDAYATADEYRKSICGILSGIDAQLASLNR